MLTAVGLVGVLLQTPAPAGVARPQRDPISLRGCAEGRPVRVIEDDVTELAGIRNLRLTGSRALLEALRTPPPAASSSRADSSAGSRSSFARLDGACPGR